MNQPLTQREPQLDSAGTLRGQAPELSALASLMPGIVVRRP